MTARTARITAQSLGLLLIGGGCWWLVHPALSMIVVGGIVLGFGVHATLRGAR